MKTILIFTCFIIIILLFSGCIEDNGENEDKIKKMPPVQPHFYIISPSDNTQVSGLIEIVGRVNEVDIRVNLIKVEYQIDLGPWKECNEVNKSYPGEWKIKLNTSDLPNGWHEIRIRAVDDYYDEDWWPTYKISLEVRNER